MSGHSKWNNIRVKKGKTDAQRAKVFTKISREIIVAVKEGGGNPASNGKLRDVIAKARANNIPNDNIKRVIDKASASSDASNFETGAYEGYGPGGVAVIVETMTDNRNRVASEMRHAFDKSGGALGAQGSVSWNFARKGVLRVWAQGLDDERVMEDAMDAGCGDFSITELTDDNGDTLDAFEMITEPDDLGSAREALDAKGYKFAEAQIEMLPKNTVEIDEETFGKLQKLLDMLEDSDDVQNVWHNAG
ncbi:MAG: YebC/PmpR family DNA-binding transcriptional regulator [Oscillospiraceae bacterium]|jgi:YebC/PmpR family DNA-binding regulatory protein|nr:YebC/PmpR family DNA-binding transcriptional regulator [Oscillospiraceae bacterium]